MPHAFYVETPQSHLHDARQEFHPENASRIASIRNELEAAGLFQNGLEELTGIDQDAFTHKGYAHLFDELRETHDRRYLTKLGRACLQAPKTHEQNVDPDTYITRSTLEVIAGSIAAVNTATRHAIQENSAAFCALRPPGHHAGRQFYGGFCLVNSAAYAANLALRKGAKKVAIIDWDAHFGNGTQSIFNQSPDVFYLSLHASGQFPANSNAHTVGTGAGKGFSLSRLVAPLTGDHAYVEAFTHSVHTVAERMRPDVVIISAGFDGHYRDPLGALALSSQVYSTLTDVVRDTWKHAPIVSVLEGGYEPHALSKSVAAHVSSLRT